MTITLRLRTPASRTGAGSPMRRSSSRVSLPAAGGILRPPGDSRKVTSPSSVKVNKTVTRFWFNNRTSSFCCMQYDGCPFIITGKAKTTHRNLQPLPCEVL